jgi:hypothetical protein
LRLPSEGSLVPYEISWKKDQNGKVPFNPIRFYKETDAVKLMSLKKITGNEFSWTKVYYKYKHPFLSTPFVLSGELREVEELTQ